MIETPRAVEVTQTNCARLKSITEAQSASDTGFSAAHWPDFHQSHHLAVLESFQTGSEQRTCPQRACTAHLDLHDSS